MSGLENIILPIEDKPITQPNEVKVEDKPIIINKDNNEETKVEDIKTPSTVVNDATIVIIDEDNKEVSYKLDKDGNALKEDGTVFKTKDELAKLEADNTDDDDVSIEKLQKITNIIPTTVDGNPVVYENTIDGLGKYISDSASILGEQYVKQEQDKLITAYPILKDVINYLTVNNGSLEGFNKKVDFASIELDDKNPEQLTAIVIESRLTKGDTKAEAEQFAKYLKADGNTALVEGAKAAKEYLVSKEKAEREVRDREIQAIELNNLNAQKQYWNTAKEKINSGKIQIGDKSYNIPKSIRVAENGKTVLYTQEQFFDYIYKPQVYNIDGENVTMTANQYKIYQENTKLRTNNQKVDNDIFEALRRFTNYDLSQFIEQEIATAQVRKIRLLKSDTSKANSKIDASNGGSKNIILKVK